MNAIRYARERGLPMISDLSSLRWDEDRAAFVQGWAHEFAMVAVLGEDESAADYWLQVWSLAVGVRAGLASVRQPDPVYFCAVPSCPGYPWAPSGSAPHPCRSPR